MVLHLGDIEVEVRFRDIKNLHLSVHPPTGEVTISAPRGSNPDVIRAFAATRLGWIRRHRARMRSQAREPAREFLDRESHNVWGKRYLMEVCEAERAPSVELTHRRLVLTVRPGTSLDGWRAVLEKWYRDQLRAAVPPLIAKWEARIGVQVERFFIQRMRTRWGSCNHRAGTIRLNTDLARHPRECLEYVVIHEMAHLVEPTHGDSFWLLLNRTLPEWRERRQLLSDLALPKC